MEEGRLPRIALEGKPTGKRAPGRPTKRWKDSWQSTSQELIQRNTRAKLTDRAILNMNKKKKTKIK